MSKPLKYYQILNQAPRSAKQNGKHRRAAPAIHGDPAGRADQRAGRPAPADADTGTTFRAINFTVTDTASAALTSAGIAVATFGEAMRRIVDAQFAAITSGYMMPAEVRDGLGSIVVGGGGGGGVGGYATNTNAAAGNGGAGGNSAHFRTIALATQTISIADINAAAERAVVERDRAIPHARIRTGEIIGHRWWRFTTKEDRVIGGCPCSLCRNGLFVPGAGPLTLSSVAHWRMWLPGETVYGDTRRSVGDGSNIPGGTYAFACPAQLAAELLARYTYNHDLAGAIGTVKMWGDVVEHEHGYRAEYAKINSIDDVFGTENTDRDLAYLRDKYLRPREVKTFDARGFAFGARGLVGGPRTESGKNQ